MYFFPRQPLRRWTSATPPAGFLRCWLTSSWRRRPSPPPDVVLQHFFSLALGAPSSCCWPPWPMIAMPWPPATPTLRGRHGAAALRRPWPPASARPGERSGGDCGSPCVCPLQGAAVLNHVACETLALLRLACVDATLNQAVILHPAWWCFWVPCCLVAPSTRHCGRLSCRSAPARGAAKPSGPAPHPHRGLHVLRHGPGYLRMQPRATASAEQDKVGGALRGGDPYVESAHLQSEEQGEIKSALTGVLTSRALNQNGSLGPCGSRASPLRTVGRAECLPPTVRACTCVDM